MKVLCLGDSLTKGYVKEMPFLEGIIIYDGGENGDLVCEMYDRLSILFNENIYDIVILLGGTNDLGSIVIPSEKEDIFNKVLNSFKQIYSLIDNNITKIIHLTIPFNALDIFESEKNNKIELNNLIKNNLHSNNRKILDINDTDFNYLSLNEEKRKIYWSDSIHYSNVGYKVLAKYIYNEINI